ncbi:MAG: hypothetical protein WC867_05045 [Candidatus Pacearchaeota archaeon]|jgi:hypothetical protein
MFNIIKKHKKPIKGESYIEKIKFLLKACDEIFSLQQESNIYEYVANNLHEFIGDSIIIVNSADEEFENIKIEALVGLGDKFSHITNLLGMNPLGKKYKMDETSKKDILKFKLNRIEGGIHSLSFKTVPKNICTLIEKAIGLKEIYGIGLVKNNIIFGSVIILIKEDNLEMDLELLESFIKIFAIAIKSKIDEDNLNESKKDLEKINKFSVGREIEMIKLKKEIVELKNKIKDNQI